MEESEIEGGDKRWVAVELGVDVSCGIYFDERTLMTKASLLATMFFWALSAQAGTSTWSGAGEYRTGEWEVTTDPCQEAILSVTPTATDVSIALLVSGCGDETRGEVKMAQFRRNDKNQLLAADKVVGNYQDEANLSVNYNFGSEGEIWQKITISRGSDGVEAEWIYSNEGNHSDVAGFHLK